jgi:hypothetical protein
MKKIKYFFLFTIVASTLFFTGCLKNSAAIPGAQGATGAAGAPGGDFLPLHTITQLSTNTLQTVGNNKAVYKWSFSGALNPLTTTYFLTVYASKVDLNGQTTTWTKLPYPDVYGGDLLSASIAGDTVTVSYTGATFPSDSAIECSIVVLPLKQ